MPRCSSQFVDSWTEKQEFKKWLQSGRNKGEAKCVLCSCFFSVANGGISQVKQHAKGQSHIKNESCLANQTLLGLSSLGTLTLNKSVSNWCHEDIVSRAEILMIMRLVKYNHSFASCDDLVEILKAMFPNEKVVKDMSLGSRKVSYAVSHGLGPYFHQHLLVDLGSSYYTLLFDETTNSMGHKQLDFFLRYWSAEELCVKTCYLTSLFLGHATADIIFSNITSTLQAENLPLSRLLMIGSDGPNVNISVLNKMQKFCEDSNTHRLIDFGFCNLHAVHNSVKKGLAVVDNSWEIEEFVQDLHSWFRSYPSRREDLQSIQQTLGEPEYGFLRFVSNRWLTMGDVVQRILLAWDPLYEYFVVESKKPGGFKLPVTARYYRILGKLKNALITKIQLNFILHICSFTKRFLKIFQSQGPLIHILYDELKNLMYQSMLKILDPSCVEGKTTKELVKLDLDSEILLHIDKCDIGSETSTLFKQLKNNEKEYRKLGLEMRNFVKTMIIYMQHKFPLDKKLLKNLQCLHPLLRSDVSGCEMIETVVKCIPHFVGDRASLIDSARSEWLMYQQEKEITENWFIKEKTIDENGNPTVKYERIDHYWKRVISITDNCGNCKYKTLSQVVKLVLCLSHGQADVERGFSINKHMLGSRTSLALKTVIGLRTIKDYIQSYQDITSIPITKKLLSAYRSAHHSYQNDMKSKPDSRKKKTKKLETVSSSVLNRRREWEEKQKQASSMMNEAQRLLQTAIDTGTQDKLRSAQALLKAGNDLMEECVAKLSSLDKSMKTNHPPAKKRKTN